MQVHCNAAEHLINVRMRVTDRKERKINILEDPTINQAFKICKDVAILAFSEVQTREDIVMTVDASFADGCKGRDREFKKLTLQCCQAEGKVLVGAFFPRALHPH